MLFVCVGDCGIDRFVEPRADLPGGCALNVAAHLSDDLPAGHRVEVVSAVGDDADATLVRRALGERGLGRYVRTAHGRTPSQKIALGRDGERRFCGYDEGILRSFRLDGEQRELLREADLVHVVAFTQALPLFEAVMVAPRRGRLCVDFTDMTDFAGSMARIAAWLDAIDVAFFGLTVDDAPLMTALEEHARRTGKTVVVTLGGEGSVCFSGSLRHQAPAYPVARVVDTTGAGDTYAGVFMSRYFLGTPIPDAMRAAAREAAATVARLGAFATAAAPTLKGPSSGSLS